MLPHCFTSHYPTLTLIGNKSLCFPKSVLPVTITGEGSLPALIWAHELFVTFSFPWPDEEGSDSVALVYSWCPVRVKPPQPLSIQVNLLLLINSSTKKINPTYSRLPKSTGGEKKAPPSERDAEERITQRRYQLNPQDGAISVPAELHPRQPTALPTRRKPKERASIDTLRRQNNCFYGLHNREAIIPFFPSLVSYQVPRQITHSCEGTHWDGKPYRVSSI